jgi:cell pole-organizing protein PopZ
MSKAEMTLHPNVEDLLASIRKAIDRQGDAIPGQTMERIMAGGIRDTHLHTAQARPVATTRPAKQDSPDRDNSDAPESLSLRRAPWDMTPATYLPDFEPGVTHEETEGAWPPEHGGPLASKATSLLSARARDTANAAFSKLADTLMSRVTGERSIEDLTQDLLRSMLKQWLDANLPDLVERLVREEIERVARRGGRR